MSSQQVPSAKEVDILTRALVFAKRLLTERRTPAHEVGTKAEALVARSFIDVRNDPSRDERNLGDLCTRIKELALLGPE